MPLLRSGLLVLVVSEIRKLVWHVEPAEATVAVEAGPVVGSA